MIEVFEGRIGGGKSYSAVDRICRYLANGGYVATNIELRPEGILAYCRDRWGVVPDLGARLQVLSDEQLALFHRHVPHGTPDCPTLVIVDEAHIFFNSRDWAQASREFLAFLTQSRKCHIDVVFITQHAANIDKQFLRLVQYVWRFRDLSKWRIPIVGLPWPFAQIMSAQFDVDGRTLLDRHLTFKDKRVFACYNTFQLVRSFPGLGQTGRVSVQKRKGGIVRPLVWLIVGMFVSGLYSVWHNGGFPWQRAAKATTAAAPVSSVAPAQVVQAMAPRRPVFRIEATAGIGQGNAVAYTSAGRFTLGDPWPAGGIVAGISAKALLIRGDDGVEAYVHDGKSY